MADILIEQIEQLKQELNKATMMLLQRPVVYVVVDSIDKVPFGSYYQKPKQRRHRG